MIIYKITNLINKKIYIGQTKQSARLRWNVHKTCGLSAIGCAIKKYGVDNFIFEIVDSAKDFEELNKKEIDWIAKENCIAPFGYNLESGGLNKGIISHQTKKKMRMAKLGKTTSEKQKKKVSEIMSRFNKSLHGQTKKNNETIKKASMGRSKGVYVTPMGNFYSSYDAAEANKCSQPTVFNRCYKKIKNWDFQPKVFLKEEN